MEYELKAYAEYRDELRFIQIYFDDDMFRALYMSEELMDSHCEWQDVLDEFKDTYYASKKDYKAGKKKKLSDWAKKCVK